jgi:anti-sigma regulatory factor (Ser/Thr protein kinase)
MGNQSRAISLDLKPNLAAPKVARAAIAGLLNDDCVDFAADALLLTSELVTNAVLYADAEVTVAAAFDPAINSLRVEVGDGSTVVPAVAASVGPDAVGGHGLRIVAAIARKWGVSSNRRGKVVWFELGG